MPISNALRISIDLQRRYARRVGRVAKRRIEVANEQSRNDLLCHHARTSDAIQSHGKFTSLSSVLANSIQLEVKFMPKELPMKKLRFTEKQIVRILWTV